MYYAVGSVAFIFEHFGLFFSDTVLTLLRYYNLLFVCKQSLFELASHADDISSLFFLNYVLTLHFSDILSVHNLLFCVKSTYFSNGRSDFCQILKIVC